MRGDENPKDRPQTIQNVSRSHAESGLTALLIIEVSLIFIVMALTGMGVLPELVVPLMFVLLVISILVVTPRSYYVSALVAVAVILSPAGAFVRSDHPSPLTDLLNAGGRLLGLDELGELFWDEMWDEPG